jgi:Spy/CpxP family protein refolding chaperone
MRKRLFLLSSLVWMMIFTACGQAPQGGRPNWTPEQMAKRQTDMIKEAASTDDATTAKVDAINLKYAKEMATLREKTTDREAMREPMKELRSKRDEELKAVLTADQWAKVQAAQEEMRKNMQGGGGGPR